VLQHAALGNVLVNLNGLVDLVSDGEDGIQGGHGVLNNESDLASAHPAHFVLGQLQDILTL
jgi:hypothetical protein